MQEIIKLVEYAELAGFPLEANGEKLTVKNGTNLPYNLKRLLHIFKDEILIVLYEREVSASLLF